MSHNLTFACHEQRDWPPLAWRARCTPGSPQVDVWHGARVEVEPNWFCEAVWSGDYRDGEFDRTDLVFGSGGRVRGDGLIFVSAGTTVDRLHSLQLGTDVWVSNSLPCLLAAVDAEIDPTYPHYTRDVLSIGKGLSRYKPVLQTSAGPVRLTYFQNLHWDGERLLETEKPFPRRELGSFEEYRSFVQRSLALIAQNMAADERSYPYRMLGTVSTGYDSPAVAALARPFGLREVLCFDERNDSDDANGVESGASIAARLGLQPHVLARDGWCAQPLAEVPFLVGDAKGMDVFLNGAEECLAGRVLLTGHHGDWTWSKEIRDGTDMARQAPSGLSLTEYRLWAAFIHCPVPYFAIRQQAEINAIGASSQMREWDLGGDYSKPIPRRILEEAGLPRGSFGREKRGASVWLSERRTFRQSKSLRDYRDWLRRRSSFPLRRRRLGPIAIARLIRPAQAVAGSIVRFIGTQDRSERSLVGKLRWFSSREYLYRYLYPWAVARATTRYAYSDGSMHRQSASRKVMAR